MATKAIILLGHGSRDPIWSEPMEGMAQELANRQPDRPVCCAYLELSQPDVFEAAKQLIAQHPQLEELVIYPVFLGMGTHVRQDLPRLQQDLAQRWPDRRISLTPALGTDARLLDLVGQITDAL